MAAACCLTRRLASLFWLGSGAKVAVAIGGVRFGEAGERCYVTSCHPQNQSADREAFDAASASSLRLSFQRVLPCMPSSDRLRFLLGSGKMDIDYIPQKKCPQTHCFWARLFVNPPI